MQRNRKSSMEIYSHISLTLFSLAVNFLKNEYEFKEKGDERTGNTLDHTVLIVIPYYLKPVL